MFFDHFVDLRHAAAAAGARFVFFEYNAGRDQNRAFSLARRFKRFANVLAGQYIAMTNDHWVFPMPFRPFDNLPHALATGLLNVSAWNGARLR